MIALITLITVWNYIFPFLQTEWLKHIYPKQYPRHRHAKSKTSQKDANPTSKHRFKRKPEWVRREVLYLYALMPKVGCRTIAATFNRLHHKKTGETVSKSYCYNLRIRHRHTIQQQRRILKNRIPKPMPKNIIWATDLTTITDSQNQRHQLLGIIDHGTRACLTLKTVQDKSTIRLLRALLDAIECYGKPKALRTDNEAVFCSRLFQLGLWLLGIQHQRTEVACPWQNGRIERFFGTFKQSISQLTVSSQEQLNKLLPEYQFWYNHMRLHQNLGNKTPAEAWNKVVYQQTKKPYYTTVCEGALAGFYWHQ